MLQSVNASVYQAEQRLRLCLPTLESLKVHTYRCNTIYSKDQEGLTTWKSIPVCFILAEEPLGRLSETP